MKVFTSKDGTKYVVWSDGYRLNAFIDGKHEYLFEWKHFDHGEIGEEFVEAFLEQLPEPEKKLGIDYGYETPPQEHN